MMICNDQAARLRAMVHDCRPSSRHKRGHLLTAAEHISGARPTSFTQIRRR